jgi:hypothetical protein
LTIDDRIARLRAVAVSTLAEKRLGIALSPGEAVALADAHTINDALLFLQRQMERKRAPARTTLVIIGDALHLNHPVQTRPERRSSNSTEDTGGQQEVGENRMSNAKPVLIATLWIASIAAVWSYLLAVIAADNMFSTGGYASHTPDLLVAGLALLLGVYGAHLVRSAHAIVPRGQKRGLQFLTPLLALLVFSVARSAGKMTGVSLSSLLHYYALLIWLGVTLPALAILRRSDH